MQYITTEIAANRDNTLSIKGYIQAANAKVPVTFKYNNQLKKFELREYEQRITQSAMKQSVNTFFGKNRDQYQAQFSVFFR